jgi:hypothetical protein
MGVTCKKRPRIDTRPPEVPERLNCLKSLAVAASFVIITHTARHAILHLAEAPV